MMNRIKYIIFSLLIMVSGLTMYSCTEVEVEVPKGENGISGTSAYEVWKTGVANNTIAWSKDAVAEADYYKFLIGEAGEEDPNVEEGASAYETWVEYISSGNVENPQEPGTMWPVLKNTESDFWTYLTGATGENGQSPTIGADSIWYIGTYRTGIRAIGVDFVKSTLSINKSNNHWLINDIEIPIQAYGASISGSVVSDNTNKSVYDLWVDKVKAGLILDPYDEEKIWDMSKFSVTDFWHYLSANDSGVEL